MKSLIFVNPFFHEITEIVNPTDIHRTVDNKNTNVHTNTNKRRIKAQWQAK